MMLARPLAQDDKSAQEGRKLGTSLTRRLLGPAEGLGDRGRTSAGVLEGGGITETASADERDASSISASVDSAFATGDTRIGDPAEGVEGGRAAGGVAAAASIAAARLAFARAANLMGPACHACRRWARACRSSSETLS